MIYGQTMKKIKIKTGILLAIISGSPAYADIINGTFEDGFTGWTKTTAGDSNSIALASGISNPPAGEIQPSLTSDQYIYTSQTGPGYSLLTQAFTVQSGVSNVFFDASVQNSFGAYFTPDSLDYLGESNQQARFEILKPGADITSVDPADIITTVYQTQVGDASTIDWTTHQIDVTAALSAYVGQDVIFRFSQVDKEGAFTLALDNINVGLTQIAQITDIAQIAQITDIAQITNIATNAFTGVIASRQDLTRGLPSGYSMMTDHHIWFKPFGGWTEQDDRQGVTGYDIDSYGLAAGFDGDVSASWNLGFALAYINSDVESNLAAGKHTINMDSYQAKVYATKMFDDVTALNLQAGLGLSDYDSSRHIFNGDLANADYDSWNVQLSVELERSYQVNDKTVMTPYVHADYGYADVESYHETGAGPLNLNVQDNSADSLIIGAGVKASHTVSDSLLLMANAGIGYDVMTDRSNLTSSFAGGGANFTTEGIEPEKFVYNAGVSAKYSLYNGAEITARYNIDSRQDYTDQSVTANFRLMF